MRRLISALALLFATALAAQPNPNVAKGFNADTTYDFSNVEAVNLFNGSITLTVPVGQAYTVSPTLSYQFMLVYTGNNWATEYNEWHYYTEAGGYPQEYVFHLNEPYGVTTLLHGNASGLGWYFSPGELYSGGTEYVAPDGSRHKFDNKLTSPDGAGAVSSNNPNVLYTNDGTYLRLRRLYGAGNVYIGAEIDFPDGNVHRFDSSGRLIEMRDSLPAVAGVHPNRVWFAHGTNASGVRTLTVTDSLGRTHSFEFSRMTSVPGPPPYKTPTMGTTRDPGHYDVLTKAHLAAFSDDGSGSATATYTFNYVDGDPQTSGMDAAPISRLHAGGTQDFYVPPTTHVPLLQSVVLPDGLSYAFTYDRGNMTAFSDPERPEGQLSGGAIHRVYITNEGSNYSSPPTVSFSGGGGTGAAATAEVEQGKVKRIVMTSSGYGYTSAPQVVITPNGSGSGAAATAPPMAIYGGFSGNVSTLQLPTLGTIEWKYRRWVFPNEWLGWGCPKDFTLNGPCGAAPRSSVGVASRISKDQGGTIVAKREYSSELKAVPGHSYAYHSQITTVQDYEKNSTGSWVTGGKTEHYYSVGTYEYRELTSAKESEYGLPFTRYPSIGITNPDPAGGPSPRFLSTATYDASGALKQTTYVAHAYNGSTTGYTISTNRTQRDHSIHYLDNNTWVATTRSGFNGLGHYRFTTRSSNIPGTPTRESFTSYTMSVAGEYDPVDPLPAWITGAHASTQVTEGDRTVKAEFCYDGQFLTKKRLIRDPLAGARGTSDVVVTYEYDSPRKNLIAENYYGGDLLAGETGVGNNSLCSLTQYGPRDYRIVHKPVNPATNDWTATTTWEGLNPDPSDPVFTIYTSDVTIDRNTGLIKESRDITGMATVFKYDALGRLTSVRPVGRAWANYEYPSPGYLKLTAVQTANGNGSLLNPLTKTVYSFDSFGRIVSESRLMPNNTTSVRTTQYDSLGRRSTVTDFAAPGNASPPLTRFTYDYAGRILTATAPDDSVSTFSYTGASVKQRTSRIKTGVDGDPNTSGVQDQAVTATEFYDGHGRLVAVEEPSGATSATDPTGAIVRTEYTYDPADKLASVTMTAPSGGADTGAVQKRLFDYDGRGFLRWESQPEAGMTSYTYDSRGHVLSKTQSAANSQFDLKYTYDAAERITLVEARNPDSPSSFRPLKAFQYHTFNFADAYGLNLGKGKLWKALRYNYVGYIDNNVPEVYKVEDEYGYYDAAGRLTQRKTTITDEYDEVVKDFTVKAQYDQLDLLEKMWYPKCTGCGYSPLSPDRSDEVRTYDRGRLIRIHRFTDAVAPITYFPNGMRHQLPHANGVADTQTMDKMARPATIGFATWDRCVKPAFAVQPGNKTSPSPGASVTLSATVTGTTPMTYDWYDASGAEYGTTPSIVVNPTVTTTYYLVVRNACGETTSQDAIVMVGACQAPTTGTITAKIQPDRSWLLEPQPTANANRQYQWRKLPDIQTIVGTTETLLVPGVTQTTTYQLTIIDGCGQASSTVTLSVAPVMAATGLVATATANNTQVTVTWPAVTGNHTYTVERRSGADWQYLADVTTTSYVDTTVSASQTYAYRVRLGGSFSNVDVATTLSPTLVVPGQFIDTSGATNMLATVNRVRAAAGWAALTWQNVLAPTDPVVASGNTITPRQLQSCRWRINEARQALGASAVAFTDPELTEHSILALYVNEVQQAAQ